MDNEPTRYRSADEDSARWLRFSARPGDIVISTRSKSGTTWMQMICALLIFRTRRLPRPLSELSPWLDWLITPIDEVLGELEAQSHRRFIKTHTPLDGLPLDDHTTYITVARRPLDMAVSLYHQGANLKRDRLTELTGQEGPSEERTEPAPAVEDWLRAWIDSDADPTDALDSLPGVMWHLRTAWERRDQPNMVLVHFDDLLDDLEGQMATLAERLGITIDAAELGELSRAAGFDSMRGASDELAPDPKGLLRSRQAFFRSGRSGAGAELLTESELARYRHRARSLAPPDLLAWLDR